MLENHNFVSVSYSLIGNRSSFLSEEGLYTFLLLSRRGKNPFRNEILSFLSDFPFISEILVFESPKERSSLDFSIKSLSKVRFIVTQEISNIGEKINLGIWESQTNYVFVLWDDCEIRNPFWLFSFLEDMRKREHLCVVPELQDNLQATLPYLHVPSYYKSDCKIIDLISSEEHMQTLYPHDYMGLYSKKIFLSLGGFDSFIRSSLWQKMEFGFRSYMWGEIITASRKLKIRYLEEVSIEDSSQKEDYGKFYLKVYWPYFSQDHVFVSFWRFCKLLRKSSLSLKNALKQYYLIGNWLKKHKYRFKKDTKGVIELWESSDF